MPDDDHRNQEVLRLLSLVEQGELEPAAAERLLAAVLDDHGSGYPSSVQQSGRSAAPPSGPEPQPTTEGGDGAQQFLPKDRRDLPLEVRRLEREARRLAHEAHRMTQRELKDALREAKTEIKNAFRLSVAESKRAVSQVEGELRALFGEERAAPRDGSWLANLAGLDYARDRIEHTARVLIRQEIDGGERLVIRSSSGDVTVRGWDEPRLEVQGSKTAWGMDREMAQDRAESMPLEIQRRNGEILIEARAPVPAGIGLLNLQRMRTNLVIMMPRNLPVVVAARSGDVSIDGHEAAVEIGTTSGDVVLSGLRASGDIETTSGDIRVERCRSMAMTLTTLSGDISAGLMPQEQGEYRLRSAKGDIDVELGGDVDTEVIAETDSGDMSHGRTLALTRREPGRLSLRYPNPHERGRAVALALVRITTIRGDISVS